jgi:hypothetical protein
MRLNGSIGVMAAALLVTGCAGAGAIGDILGGVLGGNQAQQVDGVVRGVNTSGQQLSLEQSNGSVVALAYDANTKVVYNNRLYAVTALERGDRVIARVLQTNAGGYYTDSLHVTQSVSTGTSGGSVESVQALQGTVRGIDHANGLFQLEANANVLLTVSMPYNASASDRNRFANLRSGDFVRLYGVYLTGSRVELRQFY